MSKPRVYVAEAFYKNGWHTRWDTVSDIRHIVREWIAYAKTRPGCAEKYRIVCYVRQP